MEQLFAFRAVVKFDFLYALEKYANDGACREYRYSVFSTLAVMRLFRIFIDWPKFNLFSLLTLLANNVLRLLSFCGSSAIYSLKYWFFVERPKGFYSRKSLYLLLRGHYRLRKIRNYYQKTSTILQNFLAFRTHKLIKLET